MAKWLFAPCIRIAVAAVAIGQSANFSFAGFVDPNNPAAQPTVQFEPEIEGDDEEVLIELASIEEHLPIALDDDAILNETTIDPPQVFVRDNVPPAVAAPLPPAVICGGALLAGNFILARVLKRKLV